MKIDRNKPLLAMADLERERAFDEISSSCDRGLLADARGDAGLAPMHLVLILLVRDGVERVITYNAEYGDDDGWDNAGSFIRRLRRVKLLKKGESLSRVLVRLSMHGLERVRVESL